LNAVPTKFTVGLKEEVLRDRTREAWVWVLHVTGNPFAMQRVTTENVIC